MNTFNEIRYILVYYTLFSLEYGEHKLVDSRFRGISLSSLPISYQLGPRSGHLMDEMLDRNGRAKGALETVMESRTSGDVGRTGGRRDNAPALLLPMQASARGWLLSVRRHELMEGWSSWTTEITVVDLPRPGHFHFSGDFLNRFTLLT
jgi:hypothetical protein